MASGLSYSDDSAVRGGDRSTTKQPMTPSSSPSLPLSHPPPSSSLPLIIKGRACYASKKNDIMGDSFFGTDDLKDTSDDEDVDFMYREEEDGECMRRGNSTENFNRRRRSWLTWTGCFEFLKLFKF